LDAIELKFIVYFAELYPYKMNTNIDLLMRFFNSFFLIITFTLSICVSSFAQTVTPPDAGSILKQLQKSSPGISTPTPKLQERKTQTEQPITSGADANKSITISKFSFEGNTVVSTEELNNIFNSLLNKKISINDLKLAIDQVAILYDKKGYVGFARLASQDITNQNLKILITEGKFGGVKLDPKNEKDLNVDAEIVKKIVENSNTIGQPINTKRLDETVLIASGLSGILVGQTLYPGQQQGQTDVLLRITNLPQYQFLISADNFGSVSTGQNQGTFNAAWLSPSKIGDRLDFVYNHSEGVDYESLSYNLPVGILGTKIGVTGSNLKYNVVNGQSKSLDLTGTSKSYGLNVSHPIILSRTMSLTGIASIERKDLSNEKASVNQSKYTTDSASIGSNFEMPINYLLGGQFNTGVFINSSYNDYDSSPLDFKNNKITERTDGRNNRLTANVTYQQAIVDTIDSSIRISGQLADRNLDSSQKIYLGGPSGVRAYPASEGSGANGYILNIEVAKTIYESIKVKAFYDYAEAQQYVTTAIVSGGLTSPNNFSLQGYGVGLDASYAGALLNVSLAERLKNNPLRGTSGSDTNGQPKRPEFWEKISYGF